MRIPANVLNFAADKVDIYKAFGDYFNHYQADRYGAKVSYDTTVSFDEKEAKMNAALMSEIKRVSGTENFDLNDSALANHPVFKYAAFAVVSAMIDSVLPDSIINSVGAYTEVRTGGFGDNFDFEVKPRDLFAVTKNARGKRHTNIQKQYNGQVTVTPEEHDVTVGVSLYRVIAGKESLADFAMKALMSLEVEMTKNAYAAFSTAMNALGTSGDTALQISGYTQATAVELAQKVTAWNGGQKAVFMGTQLALANILPSGSAYRYDIASDFVKIGYVRNFNGFDVIELPQVADHETPFNMALADDEIYVVSPSAGKIIKQCIEGDILSFVDAVDANANLQQGATFKKSFASAVATSSVAGLISL